MSKNIWRMIFIITCFISIKTGKNQYVHPGLLMSILVYYSVYIQWNILKLFLKKWKLVYVDIEQSQKYGKNESNF